jgi:hypothetical protein
MVLTNQISVTFITNQDIQLQEEPDQKQDFYTKQKTTGDRSYPPRHKPPLTWQNHEPATPAPALLFAHHTICKKPPPDLSHLATPQRSFHESEQFCHPCLVLLISIPPKTTAIQGQTLAAW